MVKKYIKDIMFFGGVALFASGLWLINHAFALIAVGIILMALAVAAAAK